MKFPDLFRILIVLVVISHPGVTIADNLPSQAAIATAHPLATQAGIEILQQGGNAFDASVTVAATLAVVEPYSSGLGGGGFWLLHEQKNNRDIMVDGREKAPLLAHRDMYLDENKAVIPGRSLQGALASGIPGVPAALVHIASQYGKLPLKKSLAPAIKIARQGFVIDEKYRHFAELRLQALQADKETARIFLHENKVPPKGYVLKQTDLANTMEKIAHSGIDGFYKGETARLLVSGVKAAQGIWSLKDLLAYDIKERAPVRFKYRDYTITSAAPPSSGGIALASMLGILEAYDLQSLTSVTKKHLIVEAMRRAYADRAQFLGDPDFVNVPVKKLTSKERAEKWRSSIATDKATNSKTLSVGNQVKTKGTDTTHYSIIDKQGNRVAATLSINYPFGACFVPPGTGILLNDEMDDFSAKPGIPNAYGLVGAEANAISPGKRPLSSMSPTFVESKNDLAIIGTPGGSRIITMVLHAILDSIDGLSAREIVSKRRYHHQYLPDMIVYEQGAFTKKEIAALQQLGHQLKDNTSPYGGQGDYGNMQTIIWRKKNNTLEAASDPRGHGLAIIE